MTENVLQADQPLDKQTAGSEPVVSPTAGNAAPAAGNAAPSAGNAAPAVISPAAEDNPSRPTYIDDAIKETNKLSGAALELKRNLQKYSPSDGFLWPDDRAETENCIQQLKEKQILLIRGVSSEWMNWAPQRIAGVLQASVNRLWPGCEGVYRLKNDGKLSFSFWRTFEKFENPVIIVVPRVSTPEYLRNFILADWEKAYYDFKEALKAVNVFLILQIPDNDEQTNLLNQSEQQQQLRELYGSWTIPAIKLELRRKKGKSGDVLLKRIKEECGLSEGYDRRVYAVIMEEQFASDDEIVSIIREEIRIRNAESDLLEKSYQENTELKLRLIYCAAFFHEMVYADFRKIASCVLRDQAEEIRSPDGTLIEKKPLNDIWSKPLLLKKVIADCQITTRELDKVACISFTRRIKYEAVKKIFLEENFIFGPLTEELINQDVLFDDELSDKLQMAVARVIVLMIRNNHTTYDGIWLLKKAVQQIDKLYAGMPEETRRLIEIGEAYFDFNIDKRRLEPMEYLLKELLLSNRQELIQIVKIFFEELIGSGLKKKVALGLAIDLYKELRDEGNFPEEELDLYFKRSLEEGNQDDKFDAYRMMVRTQYYKDLYKKTSAWLADDGKNDYVWTKKFSRLYRLDYFALTFNLHFQVNGGEKEYELLATTGDNLFSEELRSILTEISSDVMLDTWQDLMEDYEYLFTSKCWLLERTVTGVEWLKNRIEPNNNIVLTLAGDIIETWFYILSNSKPTTTDKSPGDKMKAFAKLVVENTEKKKMQTLGSYWLRKARQVYPQTIVYYKERVKNEKEKAEITKKLNMRSASATLLFELIKSL